MTAHFCTGLDAAARGAHTAVTRGFPRSDAQGEAFLENGRSSGNRSLRCREEIEILKLGD
jgi:hypothetical protein